MTNGDRFRRRFLIEKVAGDAGMSKARAANAIDSFFDGITKALKKGESITFVGFGTFIDLAAQGAHGAQSSDR